MKRFLILVFSILICISLSVGCAPTEAQDEVGESTEKEEKIRIGMCFDSFVIERWTKDRDIFVSVAKELGAEVNFQNANGVIEEQVKQIEYFIDKKVDVIVIICIDSESLKDVVQKAKNAGIKVVSYDRLVTDADVDLYITFDNEKVGQLMGQALVDNGIADGKVLMVGGSPSDNNVELVENGFKSVMEDNNVEVMDSFHADGWKAELAADYIYENIGYLDEVDAIMCGNDNVASAVVPILAERRLAGEILVTGQDADLEACQRIVEGTQLMTVYKPVAKLAQKAAECAVALARGENLDPLEVTTIRNGSYDIQYLGLEPICVTRDNIDEIIVNSGFHLKEDVYLNVPE